MNRRFALVARSLIETPWLRGKRRVLRAGLVFFLVAAVGPPLRAWTVEKWTEKELPADEVVRWKMIAIAHFYQDARAEHELEAAGLLELGHEGPPNHTEWMLGVGNVPWLADLAMTDPSSVDWIQAHERLAAELGEAELRALLGHVRLNGGRAFPPSGRAPSDYSIATLTWAWHQPVQHVTRVKVRGSVTVSAGPGAEVHGAIQVEREHYGEPSCGAEYYGSMPACFATASAFGGTTNTGACGANFADADCDDGNASTLVARLTFIERDEAGHVVSERLVDDFAASACAAASCNCGVDHEP